MPSRVALVTDSTADLPAELLKGRNISVVPLTLRLGGKDYLDGIDITPDAFYKQLVASGGLAATSQPATGRFAELYERLLMENDAVLSLHLSSDLSGTYGAARQAADMAGRGQVTVVDTRLVSLALGLIVLAARQALDAGASPAEAWEQLMPLRDAMRIYFVVGSLEYLRRGGRIGRAGALAGSLLQIKPVLTLSGGVVSPMERVRTADRALARVIDLTREPAGQLCAAVGHTACPETAQRLVAGIEDRCESLLLLPVGPVVGAHTGPGLIGIGSYPAELCPLSIGRFTAAGTN
jgi:DegV family protein with EDD domain